MPSKVKFGAYGSGWEQGNQQSRHGMLASGSPARLCTSRINKDLSTEFGYLAQDSKEATRYMPQHCQPKLTVAAMHRLMC